MANRSFTSEAVDGMFWQGLTVSANILLRAGILILLARSIGPAPFGVIAAATVVTSITEKLSQIGVARVLVQRLRLLRNDVKNAFAISLLTGMFAMAGIFVMASFLASQFRIAELALVLQFLSLTLLVNNLANVSAGLLQRARRFKAMGLIDLGSYMIGYGAVGLPMAWFGFGTWALAMAQMMQSCSRAVMLFALSPPAVRFWPDWKTSPAILSDGTGFSLGQIGNYIAIQVDNFIVGRLLGVEALGFYSRAYQFLMLPAQMLGNSMSTVLFPSIASIQDQPQRAARAYLRALGVVAMLTLPASGVLLIVAPELVRFLLGTQWAKMTIPFQILVAGLLFRTSYKISDAVTLAMGSMYRRAWRQWIYAGLVAVCASFGAHWGIVGVSAGVDVAVACNFLLMLGLARSVLPLDVGPIVLVHLRQLGIAVTISLPAWIVAKVARDAHASDFTVLSTATLAAAIAAAILWFGFRRVFGDDGAWLHQQISAKLRRFGKRQAAPSST